MKLVPSAKPRQGLLALTLLAALLSLAACDRAASRTQTALPEPKQFLENIYASMAELESVHGELELAFSDRADGKEPFWVWFVDFDIQVGGDSRLKGTNEAQGKVIDSTETRVVDGIVYTREPLTAPWSKEDDPEFEAMASLLMDEMANYPQELDSSTVTVGKVYLGGEEVYHISGKSTYALDQDDVQIWVGLKDLLLRQHRRVDTPSADTVEELTGLPIAKEGGLRFMISTLRLSRFNEPVHVEAPDVASSGEE